MPTIFEPKNINALLNIKKRYPESVIFSGGVETVLKSSGKQLSLPESLIYIGNVEELQKMKRSERYLEIGAATKVSQIIDKGKNIIPSILLEAMKKITPPNFKNLYTIGGLICSEIERNSIFSVLCILDAKLEVRSASASRWISTSSLFGKDSITLAPEEIVTKIRIFLSDFDINIHRRIENDYSINGGAISFSAIANILKGNINFIKFIYSVSDLYVIRSKETESELTGLNLPVNEKNFGQVMIHFNEQLESRHGSMKKYRKKIVSNTFEWFLNELSLY